ncbi:2-dehydropantoate 2-reductase [Lecanosticta acicola]|uniref:2-dehydropantoate 2-reductase n=1 Tax=Lecanosticta acicola TaxID=111012 RepID=A0AAI8YRP8_9PEZI|nr:2-dehydropantoate 2-reductase [Lecanosticta acicola]
MENNHESGENPQPGHTYTQEPVKPWGPIDRQYAKISPDVPRNIHIVGTGSIGKLVAHSLRGIPDPPPVTLIFHRGRLALAWDKSERRITVQDGEYTVPRGGFDFELYRPYLKQHGVMLQEVRDKGQVDIYGMSDDTGLKPHEVAEIVAEQKTKDDAGERGETGSQDDDKTVGGATVGGRENAQRMNEAAIPEDEKGSVNTAKAATDADYQPLEDEPRELDDFVSFEPIHNLIVTTKTVRTVTAVAALKHRLTRDSTICFLQNGMGVIDAVNEQVFPDEATRPNYVQGIISHGANVPPQMAAQDPFFVVHAGHGTIFLGVVPRKSLAQQVEEAGHSSATDGAGEADDGELDETQVEKLPESARYLIRTLTRTPVLAAVAVTPIELLQLQLEKLAVNSILNPLTSLFDNRNGTLNYNFPVTRLKRLMLAETCLVIRSLPELRGLPNVPTRFSSKRLENMTTSVAGRTKDNISSMLADMRAGRQTEIQYINGYIIRRGEELGVKCVVNYAMMQAVLAKSLMIEREYADEVPVEGAGEGLNRE